MMLCEEIMKRDVRCCGPQDPVEHAARQMREHNLGFIPICDAKGRAVGTLTDRDITLRIVAERRPADTLCGEVMSRDIVACRPKDNLLRAEQLMAEHQKSRIVCTTVEGVLIGVISLSDIALHETDRHIARVFREVSDRESFTLQ